MKAFGAIWIPAPISPSLSACSKTRECFPALASAATDYLDAAGDEALAKRLVPGGHWDSFAFVDAVEAAVHYGNPGEIELLQHVQRIEFETLAQSFLH